MKTITLTVQDAATAAFALNSYLEGLRLAMRKECDLEHGPVLYWPFRIVHAERALKKMLDIAAGVHGETDH